MSKIRDALALTGRVEIFKNGQLVRDICNLVVSGGRDWVAGRFKDAGITTQMSHMAVGTGAAKTFTANAATDQLTSTGHGFTTGQYTEVWSTPGVALPGGLAAETVYYVRAVDANTLTLHPTYADAIAGTNVVDITSAGSGGSFGASSADTALATELDRNTLTSTTVTGNQIVYEATWNPGDATGVLTESGLFNAASLGTMLARTTFPSVGKGVNDQFTIRWTITVGATG